ncbi:MAG: Txe/YoeB family addiction module toxin [Synergistaceae bacterium]|nr:Txe/YoeB family addiction module toxin [Synergistaceae bacterium]
MVKIWSDVAWNDYLYWQETDKKMLDKVNKLLKSIERDGANRGEGKPEPLKGNLSGWWSRRVSERDRIVYRITENGELEISQCKTHYGDK